MKVSISISMNKKKSMNVSLGHSVSFLKRGRSLAGLVEGKEERFKNSDSLLIVDSNTVGNSCSYLIMAEPFQDESLAKQLEGALKASGLYYQLKKHVQVTISKERHRFEFKHE